MERSIDREKVIKGLDHCAKEADCRGCIYQEQMKGRSDGCDCMREALAMLKDQEPVEPIPPIDESDLWKCGNCNHQLFRCTHQRYCEMCGRSVKWE